MPLYIVRVVFKDSGEVHQTFEFRGKLALAAFFEDAIIFPDCRYEVTSGAWV